MTNEFAEHLEMVVENGKHPIWPRLREKIECFLHLCT